MLVITLGDPFSINIEMISKLEISRKPYPVVLVGSFWHFCEQRSRLKSEFLEIQLVSDFADCKRNEVYFLDVGGRELPAERLTTEERGSIAVDALFTLSRFRIAQLDYKTSENLAVMTCPIDKFACSRVGFDFPGQTEFFENLWQCGGIMLLAGPKLKVGLVTNHLPISRVEATIDEELVRSKSLKLAETLRSIYGIQNPKIAICGLNPHCGDGGLFGKFDSEIVGPAIARLNAEGLRAEFLGPLPADTVFYRAFNGNYDCVLAMDHDQGLGPLKTVHFDEAVNVTGGLTHLRVSPDHGPAQDLFLSGAASRKSFEAAFQLTIQYLRNGN